MDLIQVVFGFLSSLPSAFLGDEGRVVAVAMAAALFIAVMVSIVQNILPSIHAMQKRKSTCCKADLDFAEKHLKGTSLLSHLAFEEGRRIIKAHARRTTGLFIPNSVKQSGSVVVAFTFMAGSIALLKLSGSPYTGVIAVFMYLAFFIIETICFACMVSDATTLADVWQKIKLFFAKREMKTEEIAPGLSFDQAGKVASCGERFCLLDARSKEEYEKGTLTNAMHWGGDTNETSHDLDGAVVFVFSNCGYRSFLRANELRRCGIKAFDIGGVRTKWNLAERFAIEVAILFENGWLPEQVKSCFSKRGLL